MQASFEYRGYQVTHEGLYYVAREVDLGFEGVNPTLRAVLAGMVIDAIDSLWNALETNILPEWFVRWLEDPTDFIDVTNKLLRKEELFCNPNSPLRLIGSAPSFAA